MSCGKDKLRNVHGRYSIASVLSLFLRVLVKRLTFDRGRSIYRSPGSELKKMMLNHVEIRSVHSRNRFKNSHACRAAGWPRRKRVSWILTEGWIKICAGGRVFAVWWAHRHIGYFQENSQSSNEYCHQSVVYNKNIKTTDR